MAQANLSAEQKGRIVPADGSGDGRSDFLAMQRKYANEALQSELQFAKKTMGSAVPERMMMEFSAAADVGRLPALGPSSNLMLDILMGTDEAVSLKYAGLGGKVTEEMPAAHELLETQKTTEAELNAII